MNRPIMVQFEKTENRVTVTTYERALDFSRIPRRPYCRKFGPFYFMKHDIINLLYMKKTFTARDNRTIAEAEIKDQFLIIQMSWLKPDGELPKGEYQALKIPIDTISAFLRSNQRILTTVSRPGWRKNPIRFKDSENLNAIAQNHIIRKKFQRFFREFYNSVSTEFSLIKIFDGFLPYSFVFECYKNGLQAVWGKIILHDQENLKKSYYEIHT